jgi:ribosomal protein L7Ae-like RNA K-turn-binding protein
MYKMAKELEKINTEERYIKILNVLSKSDSLCFGMEMTFENQKKLEMLIIAKDVSQKNKEKLIKLCADKNIKYIEVATKEILGKFFGKESINVIGIMDEKVANGLKTL